MNVGSEITFWFLECFLIWILFRDYSTVTEYRGNRIHTNVSRLILIEVVKFALFQISKFKEKVSYTLNKKTNNTSLSGSLHLIT